MASTVSNSPFTVMPSLEPKDPAVGKVGGGAAFRRQLIIWEAVRVAVRVAGNGAQGKV